MSKQNIAICIFLFFLLNSCVNKSRKLNCSNFKKGYFFSTIKENGIRSQIDRSDTLQIESDNDGKKIVSRIKWLDDCQYELRDILDTNGLHSVISRIVKTKSGEANGTKYYYSIVESTIKGANQKNIDTLYIRYDGTD